MRYEPGESDREKPSETTAAWRGAEMKIEMEAGRDVTGRE